jgi:hypothetical protein
MSGNDWRRVHEDNDISNEEEMEAPLDDEGRKGHATIKWREVYQRR